MDSTSSEESDRTSDIDKVNLERSISLSPFDMIGSWDTKTLADVSLSFSQITRNHVTNEFPIQFRKGYYFSKTIRIDNVLIPYSSDSGYGHDYIYICLPNIIEKIIKTHAAYKFRNVIGSKLRGEAGEWWKPAYEIEGVFKVTDKNQIRTPVSVEKILKHTNKGIRANLELEFSLKRMFNAMEHIIYVKIKSGFIISMGVDIRPPTALGIIPGKPTLQDITSDDIMEKLEEFKSITS